MILFSPLSGSPGLFSGEPFLEVLMDIEDSKIQFRSVGAIVLALVALMGTIIGGTWKIAAVMNNMSTELKSLSSSLDEVKSASYTLARASEQALRTAIENPSLRVPDPRDPNKLIIVYSAASSSPH